MLRDEEREAIEWLKRLVKLNKRDNLDDTFAEILLNLIEKQSKEIEELKKQDLSNSKIRDKIRNRIKYLTEYYEKEVKPEMYHWGDFTAEEYYAGIITELKMILFKDCMVDN